MRKLVWALIGLAVLGLACFGALQLAIARNGPAVLDNVDRMASFGTGGTLIERASYGDNPAQQIFVFRSGDSLEPRPTIVFVHGGSWANGNAADYGFAGRSLAERGYLVVVAGYRLYPDARYPDMLEDTASAIAWAHRNVDRLGGDAQAVWLMGHSAGAYNVVQVALERRWLDAEGVPSTSIAGVVGLAGPYDFHPFDTDSTRNSFGDAADPEATQPVNHVRPDAPPMLLVHGEPDTTVKVRNSQALAKTLEDAGGTVELMIYPEMDHYDPLLSIARPWRDRRDVMARIESFIAKNSLRRNEKDTASSLDVQGESR